MAPDRFKGRLNQNATELISLGVSAESAGALLKSGGAHRSGLREFLGGGAVLAHHDAPGFAYLALDASERLPKLRPALRSVVVLRAEEAIVVYDLARPTDAGIRVNWAMKGESEGLALAAIRPQPGEPAGEEYRFVNVISRGLAAASADGPDLIGAMLGGWVVLFHTEPTPARSPQSFDISSAERLRIIVAGLAPGVWEIWRNGWLEEHDGVVRMGAYSLYFEGPAGHYFLRRL